MTQLALLTACAALATVVLIGATGGGCAGPHDTTTDTWADAWRQPVVVPGVERPLTVAEQAKL